MPTKIDIQLPYGSLICQCGNTSRWSFCDREGNVIDKNELWRGLYLCDDCGLIAHWPTGEVIRQAQS